MKKGLMFSSFIFALIFILSFSVVSAGVLGNWFGKITGNVVDDNNSSTTTTNSIYPSPFIVNDAVDVAIVYGTNLGVSILEAVLAGNIQTDLSSRISDSSANLGDILVKDSDVNSVSSKNLIVLGTPCSNKVIQNVLGLDNGSNCNLEDFTSKTDVGAGQFLIQSIRSPYDQNKTLMIIVGYDHFTLQSAVSHLESQSVDTSVGSKYIGTPITSVPPSCTDSDNGKNYYKTGTTTGLFNGKQKTVTDFCIVNRLGYVGEYFCNGNNATRVNFACPYGCEDGACKSFENICRDRQSLLLSLNDSESVDLIINSSGDYSEVKVSLLSFDLKKQIVRLRVDGKVTKNLSVGESYSSPKGYHILFSDTGEYLQSPAILLRTFSQCGNIKVPSDYACRDLADKTINTFDFSSSEVNWQWSWGRYDRGDYFIENKLEEKYSRYYGSWHASSDDYSNYYLSYDVKVFDNKDIDMGNWLKNSLNTSWGYSLCTIQQIYSNNEFNPVYVCSYGLDEDSSSKYQSIFWTHENVLVEVDNSQGKILTEEEMDEISSEKIIDLLENLQDNSFEYVGYEDFSIDSPFYGQIESGLQLCSSDLKNETDLCSPSWSCKTEPVICPEHGFQTRICIDNFCGNVPREERIECSPGICSGCYIPKWFGYDRAGDRCIPYGFRFSNVIGQEEDIIPYGKIERTNLNEGDYGNDYSLIIESNESAVLILFAEKENITLDLTPGGEYSIDLSDRIAENVTLVITVNKIVDLNGAGYVDLTIEYKGEYVGLIDQTVNSYCDIDGEIKRQRRTNEQITCQNNYECESNLCSSGECIELKSLVEDVGFVKRISVKIYCSVIHPLNDGAYNACVADYLSTQY